LEGIVTIKSSSQSNISLVSVEFAYTRNVKQAALDVTNAISRIRTSLPKEIKEPQVLTFSTSDRPVITVGITAKSIEQARRVAEDVVAKRFQRIPGVAAVDVFGGARRAVLVEVHLPLIKSLGIPLERIVKTLNTHNVNIPAGQLRRQRTVTNFRIEARASSLEQLRALPLLLPDGGRVLLGSVATITEGSLDDDSRFSIDGKRYIALQVYKSEEANTVKVVDLITAEVKKLKQELPAFELTVGEESGSFTKISIDNLFSNIWQALLLASLLIFLFIGRLRLSLVAMISMPLSYGITFALMKLSNTEFNMVTLSAIILAVGMVVDATVVILENISRIMSEEDLPIEEAVIRGTDEVRLPVFAGTATTVAVLIPLLFTGGFTGKTFAPMALTLLFAFSSSVVVALVLVPVLAVYTGTKISALDRVGMFIASPFTWLMERVRMLYARLLRGALRQRLITVVITLALFGGGMYLLKGQGMETLPKMDSGAFFVSLETPSGTSLLETQRAVRAVEQILSKEPEVRIIQSQIGFEEGMKSFSSTGANGPTQGFITVTLTDRTKRKETIWEIEARVRGKIERVPGIQVFTVREQGNTAKSTTLAPVMVRISGDDPLVLVKLAKEVKRRLSGVPSLIQPVETWRIDMAQTVITVDRLRAEQLGLSPEGVARLMTMGLTGIDATEYYGDPRSPIPINVRFARGTSSGFENYPLFDSSTGSVVPLSSVISTERRMTRPLVTRENQQATLDVTAFVEGRPLSFVLADVSTALAGITIPHGYTVDLSGEKKDLAESKRELGGAFLIALLAVYLLLVGQLRSFLHPLTIMMSIPLSLSGVALALYLTSKPISMPVMVGLILLVGTVVNNAIILIEFIREARDTGTQRTEALMEAVSLRFRPIMMTSLSTIVGMIPLAGEWALGSERFAPLAIAVIGGMSAATMLTLVFIPVLYSIFDDLAAIPKKLRKQVP
ncbi:efflux RND transporter permease subunit, partial [Myxococcota bacterium]|nr:efflux RND transporter permease subunit [Myxococcota bacterium]MBU1536632.1 efflux RND transporter permease subunit [Myxococcota bacterium]